MMSPERGMDVESIKISKDIHKDQMEGGHIDPHHLL